ncbi:hypothetical protein ACFQFC_10895 [Amorphoplanes digitatis]|uniref:Uncharacterized protein n=1 Tax=Actinoplanes digitatis TaxID=1868 RepID=A0A7W7MSI4_9ACTN|nr:hypothetical protein [Actinoplanes digitatis]MBB4764705.1 hypothetical protein [Actinoplanes digitatis]
MRLVREIVELPPHFAKKWAEWVLVSCTRVPLSAITGDLLAAMLAEALADGREFAMAERVAETIAWPEVRASAWTAVAAALARAGHVEASSRAIDQAAAAARATPPTVEHAFEFVLVGGALIAAGQDEETRRLLATASEAAATVRDDRDRQNWQKCSRTRPPPTGWRPSWGPPGTRKAPSSGSVPCSAAATSTA